MLSVLYGSPTYPSTFSSAHEQTGSVRDPPSPRARASQKFLGFMWAYSGMSVVNSLCPITINRDPLSIIAFRTSGRRASIRSTR